MKTIICRHCDMVSQVAEIPTGHVAKCFRCRRVLLRNSWCKPASLFALSLTALIISFPAFYLPLISIHLLGITEDTNLLQGALMMVSNAPVVATVVLFCAVIAPSLLMLSITMSTACLTFNYHPQILPMILKITYRLMHWSMLEVYAVSLMVAIFKLMNYADLFIGIGFYFFVALLIINMTVISHYNHHALWERYINE